jgi:Xaa-Pro dipeptidase
MDSRTVAEQLTEAQARAASLFQAIEAEQLVRAGQTEDQIDRAIFALAKEKFGVEKHWHRRVVRSGPHTRMLFKELPPDRLVEEDDIVSIDLGPVFDSMEADFGRSYVIGNSAAKTRLQQDLEYLFNSCRDFYFQRPELTGAQFYQHVCAASIERGWTFGGLHAGHLVGAFPFSRTERDSPRNRIRPDNLWPMNLPDESGHPRHWVLEIHLLDPTGTFGGFYEELLVPRA